MADETLWKLGKDGSPCRVDVPQGYRCESDSLDMDDLACIPKHAPLCPMTYWRHCMILHEYWGDLLVAAPEGHALVHCSQEVFMCLGAIVIYFLKLHVLYSFDEDEVELSSQANREERAQFQELSPAANLLQSQNAAGQLASAHCLVVNIHS